MRCACNNIPISLVFFLSSGEFLSSRVFSSSHAAAVFTITLREALASATYTCRCHRTKTDTFSEEPSWAQLSCCSRKLSLPFLRVEKDAPPSLARATKRVKTTTTTTTTITRAAAMKARLKFSSLSPPKKTGRRNNLRR